MNRIFLFFAMVCFSLKLHAQDPVRWTFSAKKIADKTYEVRLSAAISNKWHIYSQHTPDGGPLPAKISFTQNPLLTFEGAVAETGKKEEKYEPLFGITVKQYANQVEFVQLIKLKIKVKTSVSGSIEYMVCDDKQCLPPFTKKFSLELK